MNLILAFILWLAPTAADTGAARESWSTPITFRWCESQNCRFMVDVTPGTAALHFDGTAGGSYDHVLFIQPKRLRIFFADMGDHSGKIYPIREEPPEE